MKKTIKLLILPLLLCIILTPLTARAYDGTKLQNAVLAISKRTVCKAGQFEVTTVDKNSNIPNGTCYASDKYEDAKKVMNDSVSNFDKTTIIIEYSKDFVRMINAKYALLDMDRYNDLVTTNLFINATTNSAFTYINGYNGAEAAFIDGYNASTNRAYLKIAGFTGYVEEGVINAANKTRPTYNIVPLPLLISDEKGQTLASYYYVSDKGDLVHNVAYNIHTKYNNSYMGLTLGPAPSFMKKGVRYYSFDGIYFYQNDIMAMLDDYKALQTSKSVNKESPYYNYYQYMPYRLQSNYSSDDINNYLEKRFGINYKVVSGDTFGTLANKYDVTEAAIKEINNITKLTIGQEIIIPPARIDFVKYIKLKDDGKNYQWISSARPYGNISQLSYVGDSLINMQNKFSQNAILTLAHAINESGWGKSDIAFAKNNLFGLGAVDSNAVEGANRYKTVEDCIVNFADGWMNYKYGDPGLYANQNYYTYYYGFYFGNKGSGLNVKYASDPYWGEKVAQNYYNFEKANGLLDYNNQKRIAIKQNKEQLNVYKEASTSSNLLYGVKDYMINVPFVILGEVTGKDGKLWYKVKTDIALDKDRNPITLDDGTYDKVDRSYNNDYSYGYILASSVIVPSEGRYYEEVTGEYYFESILYNKDTNTFNFKGFLAQKDYDNKKTSDIQFNLIAVNVNTKEETVFELSRWLTGYPFEIPNDKKLDYSGAWFNGNVNLNDLPQGDYLLYITNTTGGRRTKTIISNAFAKEISKVTDTSKRGYLFRTNYYLKTNQVELFIRDEGLITNVNAPTIDNMFNEYSVTTPMTFKDNFLNIKGTSFNIKGNYASGSAVERWIVLENTASYKRVVFDKIASITNGDYAITLRQPDNLDKTRAWYQASLDISTLEAGTYVINIRTKTGAIDDYGELTNIFATSLDLTHTIGNKEYKLVINTDKRNRIELIVKDK